MENNSKNFQGKYAGYCLMMGPLFALMGTLGHSWIAYLHQSAGVAMFGYGLASLYTLCTDVKNKVQKLQESLEDKK